MNKIILLGRLTRDPEIRHGGANNTEIARFSIAVNRRYKRDGDPEADFFNCVSFGKQAEFAEKYLRKGTKILLEGEVRNNNYKNRDGQMVYGMEILVAGVEFAERKSNVQQGAAEPVVPEGNGFTSIQEGIDDIPFA